MYIDDQYRNNDPEAIRSFIRENSFGILINQTDGKPWGTHIPLELDYQADGTEILHGHIAKANPQSGSLQNGDTVLAIFNGPHSYISSSWYDHENVPTWNYIAVHIYGTIRIIEGAALVSSLKKLVDKYEATSGNPTRIEDLSDKTMRQLNGIIGFEITITEIQAVHKLSQNRDNKNYSAIIDRLEAQKDPNAISIACEMRKNRK
ncbi:FMN-binding negative transcriptional regulator [Flavobacterium cerinum]|uniref:FMN-binding negative transcriptional regulator n=1 Tax=Flavobacterium cerinum TaxID=2502784 RepID=A0ABY5IWD9_9FLAO|nr:FMN-binding negative transcriptional regulator [Flavobacterium cerinum]UUC47125.1 FMN-binding negative transcriptional regulator [Flavobacterium cerinum]